MLSFALLLAASESPIALASGGSSWWQTLGGFVAVFGLLMLSLKLLSKWNRRQGSAEASLLTVWALGPKREIQVLRLGDEVHFIYRHESAMVLLKQSPLAEFEAGRQASAREPGTAGWQRFFPQGLPFLRSPAVGGRAAPDLTSS